jgi:hypothetical protein
MLAESTFRFLPIASAVAGVGLATELISSRRAQIPTLQVDTQR